MPPNPPSNAHGFTIPKSEKEKFLAPPSQILETPLEGAGKRGSFYQPFELCYPNF